MPSSHRPALILASTSRYRRELLARLGLPFEVVAPEVDETVAPGERPDQVARRLSHAKAAAVAKRHPHALVIGSDQTATLDDLHTVGKPGDHASAQAQLRAASGRMMRFYTGLTVLQGHGGFERHALSRIEVQYRVLSEALIEDYLRRDQPYDCAGSARIESLGVALVSAVRSEDPTALIGLPLIVLTGFLSEAGLPPLGAC